MQEKTTRDKDDIYLFYPWHHSPNKPYILSPHTSFLQQWMIQFLFYVFNEARAFWRKEACNKIVHYGVYAHEYQFKIAENTDCSIS